MEYMFKKWLPLCGLVCLAACSGNDKATNRVKADSTALPEPVVVKPAGPPAKVYGAFMGDLPCADCKGSEAFLTVNPNDSYSFTKHNKGAVKTNLITTANGLCIFENGILKLLDKNNSVTDMFRIISEDSLHILDAKRQPAKKGILVRSNK